MANRVNRPAPWSRKRSADDTTDDREPSERRMAGVQDRLGRMETGPASQAGQLRLRLLPWRERPAVWWQRK